MSKEKQTPADIRAGFNLAEFQKLSPEAQAEYVAKYNEQQAQQDAELKALQDKQEAENESLKASKVKQDAELKSLKAALKEKASKTEKVGLPVIDVDEDLEAEVEGGEYEFTSPSFTWDDNSVVNVSELVAAVNGKDSKLKHKAEVIIASLLQRKSGILVRKGGSSDE